MTTLYLLFPNMTIDKFEFISLCVWLADKASGLNLI